MRILKVQHDLLPKKAAKSKKRLGFVCTNWSNKLCVIEIFNLTVKFLYRMKWRDHMNDILLKEKFNCLGRRQVCEMIGSCNVGVKCNLETFTYGLVSLVNSNLIVYVEVKKKN